jgi:quercetin dioxygenase-like cupin family protein
MGTKQSSDARESLRGAASAGDLVAYQAGAIVSRTLFKNENGSVTLFAFDASQAISEHTVPYEALALVIDGEAEIQVGGKKDRVEAGSLVLMPANVPHALVAPARFKMLLAMVKLPRE